MKFICILGTGNIGLRHFQSILKSNLNLKIYLIDSNKKNLDKADKYYNQINKKNIKIYKFIKIKKFNKLFDLLIISTNADVRRKVFDEFIKNNSCKNILFEKIVFQRLADFYHVKKKLKDHNIKAYVNCPRRLYPIYNKLKYRMLRDKIKKVVARGNMWNMATNTIHFIDLFYFLTNNLSFQINKSFLVKRKNNLKRNKFIEFYGKISLSNYQGELVLVDNDQQTNNIIEIFSSNYLYIINESNKTISKIYLKNKKLIYRSKIKIPLQSQLSIKIMNSIFYKKKVNLLSLSDSIKIHKIIFDLMIKNSLLKNINNIAKIT